MSSAMRYEKNRIISKAIGDFDSKRPPVLLDAVLQVLGARGKAVFLVEEVVDPRRDFEILDKLATKDGPVCKQVAGNAVPFRIGHSARILEFETRQHFVPIDRRDEPELGQMIRRIAQTLPGRTIGRLLQSITQ